MEFRTRAAADDPRASGRRTDRVGMVAVVTVAIPAGTMVWGAVTAGEGGGRRRWAGLITCRALTKTSPGVKGLTHPVPVGLMTTYG